MVKMFERGGQRINNKFILEALQEDTGTEGNQKAMAIIDDDASNTLSFLASEGKMWQLLSAVLQLGKDRTARYQDFDDMVDDPVIQSALELMTDDVTQYSHEMNATVWCATEHKYDDDIDDLFKNIDLENSIWGWVWNLGKYGDFFLGIDAEEGKGITGVDENIHPKMISRVDIDSKLAGFMVRESEESNKTMVTDSSKFVHFVNNYRPNFETMKMKILRTDYEKFLEDNDLNKNIDSDDSKNSPVGADKDNFPSKSHSSITKKEATDKDYKRYRLDESKGEGFSDNGEYIIKKLTSKYGTSLLQASRQVYKLLNLLEAMLAMARISRTPMIRVYYVNTEGMTPKERKEFIKDLEGKFKVKKAVDIPKNVYKEKYYPAGWNDDIFIPYAGGKGDMRVETVGGEVNIKDIVDIEYLSSKLFAALRIPKQFLGFDECLRSNVRVRLLDGTMPTVGEMYQNMDKYLGKEVFTCTEDGSIEITIISHIKKTRKNADYVRVHIDNDTFFDVTPDHPCMLRNGTYCMAGDLKQNDSLMPLYVLDSKNYLTLIDNKSKKLIPFHHKVAIDILGAESINKNNVVHHVDLDKKNNESSNLEVVSRLEHYHRHKGMIDFFFNRGRTIEVQIKRDHKLSKESIDKIKHTWKVKRDAGIKTPKSEEGLKKLKEALKKSDRSYMKGENNVMNNPEIYNRFLEGVKKSIPFRKNNNHVNHMSKQDQQIHFKKMRDAADLFKDIREFSFNCAFCGDSFIKRLSSKSYDRRVASGKNRFCCSKHQRKYQGMRNLLAINDRKFKSTVNNHKVLFVEKLDVIEDAYDIGVESENHNFAISNGVFIHNSYPGGAGNTSLQRLDIRYARSIKKVQRAILEGIYRLVEIHLTYKYNEEVDLTQLRLAMVPVSSAEEDSRLEVQSNKITTLNSILTVADQLQGLIDKNYFARFLFETFVDFPGIDLNKLFVPTEKSENKPDGQSDEVLSGNFGEGENDKLKPIVGNAQINEKVFRDLVASAQEKNKKSVSYKPIHRDIGSSKSKILGKNTKHIQE
jgi:hypothetical protein